MIVPTDGCDCFRLLRAKPAPDMGAQKGMEAPHRARTKRSGTEVYRPVSVSDKVYHVVYSYDLGTVNKATKGASERHRQDEREIYV